jgi:hypothetical protein
LFIHSQFMWMIKLDVRMVPFHSGLNDMPHLSNVDLTPIGDTVYTRCFQAKVILVRLKGSCH